MTYRTASQELLAFCANLSETTKDHPRAHLLYQQALNLYERHDKDATDLFEHYERMHRILVQGQAYFE